jgi:hypothetical protein
MTRRSSSERRHGGAAPTSTRYWILLASLFLWAPQPDGPTRAMHDEMAAMLYHNAQPSTLADADSYCDTAQRVQYKTQQSIALLESSQHNRTCLLGSHPSPQQSHTLDRI